MHRHKALGVHVFAGGFTLGVKRTMDVSTHLEVHDLGEATAREVVGVDVVRSPAEAWPHPGRFDDCAMCFGNPRCTAFSSVTGGCGRESHGWTGKQTRDAWELARYAAGHFDFVVWESVQQAYSVGKPMLDAMYDEVFRPRGYRLCHLFVNAASFGNAQNRRRYFFVAYADRYRFNVQPPKMILNRPTLWDAIGHLMGRETRMQDRFNDPFGPDTSAYMFEYEREVIPHIPNGWSLNSMGRHMRDKLPEELRLQWETRDSDIPYSLFCVNRLDMRKFAPTLFSGSRSYVHPCYDRGLTGLEFASIMGWGDKLPVGRFFVQQLAKGIVPSVGGWIAEQVSLSLSGHWGDDDWQTRYDHRDGVWYGRATSDEQKTIDLTNWYPRSRDWSAFPIESRAPFRPVPDDVEVRGVLDNRKTMV